MNKTVKFLGKRYSVAEAENVDCDALILLSPQYSDDGQWHAYVGGDCRLNELTQADHGSGKTAQQAVNSLTRNIYSDFAELGELLGWEAER